DAAAPRHRKVEQQHVEATRAHRAYHVVAVAGLAGHHDRGIHGKDPAQPFAHDDVVVGDEDARAHRYSWAEVVRSGIRATTVVPPPGSPVIRTEPPSISTRSEMPRSPKEPDLGGFCGSMPMPSSTTVSTASSS